MTKNPYINALIAALYIVGIVLFIQYVVEPADGPKTILIPITMLSLLVFSAAFMGYTFFYHPLMQYWEGDKSGAVALFLHTLMSFAAITVVFIGALLVSGLN